MPDGAAPAGAGIRLLVAADAAAYRALMLEAYTLVPDAFTSSVAEREALPLDWWVRRIGAAPDAPELVWGAFVGDTLAGVAGLAFEQRERTRHKAVLFGMYLRPAARGHGLARRLVQALLDAARQAPATQIVQLTVTDTNAAAIRLYTGCGFAPFGSEPFAVRLGERYITKLHLWCRVKPLLP